MQYYSVSYKTNPPNLPSGIEKEFEEDYETFLLFGRPNKLNTKDIEDVIKSYLAQNKIAYKELIISEIKEITEQEYSDRTQYS